MYAITVNIQELKAHLSAYLRRVQAGAWVTITKRGRPIGRIVPVGAPTESHLEALDQVGLIAWNGEKLHPIAPVAQARGDRTVADLLLEDRV